MRHAYRMLINIRFSVKKSVKNGNVAKHPSRLHRPEKTAHVKTERTRDFKEGEHYNSRKKLRQLQYDNVNANIAIFMKKFVLQHSSLLYYAGTFPLNIITCIKLTN